MTRIGTANETLSSRARHRHGLALRFCRVSQFDHGLAYAMSDAVFDRPIPSEDYIQVWCAPCDQFLSFLLDGTALVNHAQRHSVIVSRDENGGIYIGRPAIPAPILPNADAMLDWHDTWMTAPDDVWGAAWRLAINGQDTRTTIRIPRS